MQYLLLFGLLLSFACQTQPSQPKEEPATTTTTPKAALMLGAEQLDAYLPLLEGKKVAMIVNQTATIGATHLVDTLLDSGVSIVKIFAPEHGFRGNADAGEHVTDSKDIRTGLPIISLYGKNKNLPVQLLEGVDVLIFDIQDVGARFYTYISTMHYAMESAAKKNIPFIVLDRPNPNGHYVDGPILDKKVQSFVGMHPIPIVHGLTVGELAKMIVGEGWLEVDKTLNLTVIPCKNYTHKTRYELPIAPSPNLPNQRSVLLYPSLCLLEPTSYSVGRGTPIPFQHYGHPKDTRGYTFTPVSTKGAKNPKWKGDLCKGVDLSSIPMDDLYKMDQLQLDYLMDAFKNNKGQKPFIPSNFFDKIAGTKNLRQQLESGSTEAAIRKSWEPDLSKYKQTRSKYLLYAD